MNRMCHAAAAAELAQRSNAAFEASCATLAELCVAISPGPSAADSKSVVLAQTAQADLSDVVCHPDGNQLLAVFRALHTHLGWSEQVAAEALLDVDMRPGGLESLAAWPPGTVALWQPGGPAAWQPLRRHNGAMVPVGRAANHRRGLLGTTAAHIEAVAALLR